jgi:hypothetical protein
VCAQRANKPGHAAAVVCTSVVNRSCSAFARATVGMHRENLWGGVRRRQPAACDDGPRQQRGQGVADPIRYLNACTAACSGAAGGAAPDGAILAASSRSSRCPHPRTRPVSTGRGFVGTRARTCSWGRCATVARSFQASSRRRADQMCAIHCTRCTFSYNVAHMADVRRVTDLGGGVSTLTAVSGTSPSSSTCACAHPPPVSRARRCVCDND